MSRALATVVVVAVLLAGCSGGHSSKREAGPGPVASFSVSPDVAAVGESIQFTDQSEGGIVSWTWDFGDETQSPEQNPAHRFASVGTFTVALTVTDAAGRANSTSQRLPIGALSDGGSASRFRIDFTYRVDGRTVEFEPVLLPPDAVVEAYYWDFGDASSSSHDSAPRHTYAATGLYTVLVRASSNATVGQATHAVAVGVASPEPTEFAQKPFVVVAVVDSGINPYHDEFRDPSFTTPPSEYINGYPATSAPLTLTLNGRSYSDSLKADEATWKGVKANTLYWIPGTRIIGAVSVVQDGSHRILDDNGHGTATASDAAGASIGTCPQCLIVVVEGLGEAPLEWAMNQPWIDVVSNSWASQMCLPGVGVCPPFFTGLEPPLLFPTTTKAAVESGKEIFFAAGNGVLNAFDAPTPTWYNAYSGPDWIVTVGAADASSGATVAGTGRPFDITSYGLNWKGAAYQSRNAVDPFSGTSAATPVAAGAYAWLVLQARTAMNDSTEGPHTTGVVATGGKGSGMLSDGQLTRAEAERALYLTARPATGSGGFDDTVLLPDSAAAFTYAGYGLVNAKSAQDAWKVARGATPVPTRTNDDLWAAQDSRIRQGIWGSWTP